MFVFVRILLSFRWKNLNKLVLEHLIPRENTFNGRKTVGREDGVE